MAKPDSTQLPGVMPAPPRLVELCSGATPHERQRQLWLGLALLLGLLGGFSQPLLAWADFAWQSELYSYVLLIPCVSVYLCRAFRPPPPVQRRSLRAWALWPLALGLGALGGYWFGRSRGWSLLPQDYLALMMSALVCGLLALALLCFDGQVLRRWAFPLGFLFFTVPIPHGLESRLTVLLQHGSAYAAQGLLLASGMGFRREALTFDVPGLKLTVAPQCSGIHSTLVLLITSLVAGFLFLKSPRRRAVLALAVLPLAVLRNGFRIFTVIELCVQIGPHMLESYIHRRGGPLFFALSLIPLVGLLFWFRRSELRAGRAAAMGSEPGKTGEPT